MVYLVGAGPGDPGLLTLRAARLLRRADVLLHDALVDPRVLELASDSAERIDVGKRCGAHRSSQEQIHELLISAARRARVVVRLKGGDPLIFGRGGEEAHALRAAGVRFRIVPGITAALAAGASVGIPLTFRGVASAVRFVSGHDPAAIAADETLVIYMGVERLRAITDELMRGGRRWDTPAAFVQSATGADERVLITPLGQLADAVESAGLGTPGLIVVGEAVRMNWHDESDAHAAAGRARLQLRR